MKRLGLGALLFHIAFIGFILMPLMAVTAVAFTSHGYLSLPYDGLSLRWFVALLHSREFIGSFGVSVGLSALSATLALLLMVPAALVLARFEFGGKVLLLALFQSPLMVPGVVLGIAFLRFLSSVGWNGTFAGLAACHIIIVAPYILRLSLTAFVNFDRNCEMAAVLLGASRWTVFRRITLPLALPGIVAGWLLAFITSFDDLTVTIFLSSPSVVPLSVRLFSRMTETIDPLIAAVSSILILLALTCLILLDRAYGVERIFASKVRD
jgi:putative spermidine/putrescine transport system permease protein